MSGVALHAGDAEMSKVQFLFWELSGWKGRLNLHAQKYLTVQSTGKKAPATENLSGFLEFEGLIDVKWEIR